ncbi:MAG: ABC transporter permease subunit, partial [Actinobacteria bacterium]|nr:ABC transporter permease subunit [Actinomycetota bacterium]
MSTTLTLGRRPVTDAAPAGPSRSWAGLGLAPFGLYIAAFFLLPTGVLLWSAFRGVDASGATTFTTHSIGQSLQGVYLTALEHSIELSAITAVVSAALGLVLAWAITNGRSGLVKQLVSSASAVLANFGGLPLAFLFVATIGNNGLLTKLLSHVGISLSDDLHFQLYSLVGVEVVYLYFLIPLMVLVITPALEGLRPQWREAADNLGASGWQYWRYVAGPILAPSIAGSVALLFCSSFSAFATADALTNGTLSLTPLQIKSELSGNVLAGPDTQNIAAALALDMVIVVVPLTLL